MNFADGCAEENFTNPAEGFISLFVMCEVPRSGNSLDLWELTFFVGPVSAPTGTTLAVSNVVLFNPSNQPIPAYVAHSGGGAARARFDKPHMPGYAWPGYAAHPNYAALTYPKQYSPTAWPYIGPFYPYPQVPLGWRKVTLEWDDGWWMLDFKNK